jgi:hypothetical protein
MATYLFSNAPDKFATILSAKLEEDGYTPAISGGRLLRGAEEVPEYVDFLWVDNHNPPDEPRGYDNRKYRINSYFHSMFDARTIVDIYDKALLHEHFKGTPFIAETWSLDDFRYSDGVYIMRPIAKGFGGGKDIRVVSSAADYESAKLFYAPKINKDYKVIVSRYIVAPRLYSGYKMHLRIYVASFYHPKLGLRMGVAPIGEIITAKEQYKPADFENCDIHDTHYGTNPQSIFWPEDYPDKEEADEIAAQIKQILEKIMAFAPNQRPYGQAYCGAKLFGMDIMVENGQAILLEINERCGYSSATPKTEISLANWLYGEIKPMLNLRREYFGSFRGAQGLVASPKVGGGERRPQSFWPIAIVVVLIILLLCRQFWPAIGVAAAFALARQKVAVKTTKIGGGGTKTFLFSGNDGSYTWYLMEIMKENGWTPYVGQNCYGGYWLRAGRYSAPLSAPIPEVDYYHTCLDITHYNMHNTTPPKYKHANLINWAGHTTYIVDKRKLYLGLAKKDYLPPTKHILSFQPDGGKYICWGSVSSPRITGLTPWAGGDLHVVQNDLTEVLANYQRNIVAVNQYNYTHSTNEQYYLYVSKFIESDRINGRPFILTFYAVVRSPDGEATIKLYEKATICLGGVDIALCGKHEQVLIFPDEYGRTSSNIMRQMNNIVIDLARASNGIKSNGYALINIDVIVDSNDKCWLIECNKYYTFYDMPPEGAYFSFMKGLMEFTFRHGIEPLYQS